MLKDKSSSAILAVSDIGKARSFYRDVLGLELVDDSMGEVLAFRTGATSLIVYRSYYAGTNRANAVVWGVDDEIETIVTALKARGVAFEGVAEALAVPGADLRLFGKPESYARRRMGVALARAADVDEARKRATQAAGKVKPVAP